MHRFKRGRPRDVQEVLNCHPGRVTHLWVARPMPIKRRNQRADSKYKQGLLRKSRSLVTKRVPLKSLRAPTSSSSSGPQYVADFLDELAALGEIGFVYQYRWPVFVVAGISGALSDHGSKTGTLVTDDASADVRMASLLIGRVFALRKNTGGTAPGQIRIGRIAENDVAISEYSISKHHCLVRPSPTRTTIEDLGSTNGSFLGTERLVPRQQYVLHDGADLVLGRFSFRYFTARGFVEYLKAELAAVDGPLPTGSGDQG